MGDVTLMHRHSWPEVQRGGERYLHDIGWYLRRNTELSPTIVTGAGNPQHDRIEDVPVQRTWRWTPHDLGRLHDRLPKAAAIWGGWTGRRAVAGADGDVVHAFSPAAVRAAVAAGRPTVFTTMGVRNLAYAEEHPRRWAVVAEAAAMADVVTAFGRNAATGLAEALERDVIALQPGIRLGDFPLTRLARPGPPTILFASFLNQRIKGFRSVLDAMPAVLDVHPEARLVVAGPGDLHPFVDAAGPSIDRIRDHIVRVLPRPHEMASLYGRSWVTVLASTREAFGLVLAESLACGTPVVASNVGGPAEILEGAVGQVGFTTPPHDADEIAAAIVRAIELAPDAATADRCRDHARKWSWVEEIGPRHARIYRELGA